MITYWEWRKDPSFRRRLALPAQLPVFQAGDHDLAFHCVHIASRSTVDTVLALFKTEAMTLTEEDKRLARDLCYARFGG